LQLNTQHPSIPVHCTGSLNWRDHKCFIILEFNNIGDAEICGNTSQKYAWLRIILCFAIQRLLFTLFVSTAVKITTTYVLPFSLIWNFTVQETQHNCILRLQKHVRQQMLTQVNTAEKYK
jgi:hypothetical protein